MPVHQMQYQCDSEAGFILLTCAWTGSQYEASVTLQRLLTVAADVFRPVTLAGPVIVAHRQAGRYRKDVLLRFTQQQLAALNDGEYISLLHQQDNEQAG